MSAFVEIHKPQVKAICKLVEKMIGVKTVDHMFAEDMTPEKVSALGKLGEFSVADSLGVKMNTEVHIGGDAGYDLIWEDYTIEVKFNTHFNGSFYMNQLGPHSPKSMRADLGVLTVCENLGAQPIVIKIAAWIDYRQFYSLVQKRKYKTTVYAVEQVLLRSFTTRENLKQHLQLLEIPPGHSKLPLPFDVIES